MRATIDPSLKDDARLGLLEENLALLGTRPREGLMKQPLRLAIAKQLERAGHVDRSELWYRRVLEDDPFDVEALQLLLNNLWNREKWGDAATMLARQIAICGAWPNLTFAYGKSLFMAGSLSEAITALTQAANQFEDDNALKKIALDLREQALKSGAVPIVHAVKLDEPSPRPVTVEELAEDLREFSLFIKAFKRMGFWRLENRIHKWIEQPEQHAQDLLHTHMKARLQERVQIFEEVDSGAGRADILIQLAGGLSVIVELKMCGPGYSSSRASVGGIQLIHYMQNLSTQLGFLLVFDARKRDMGSSVLMTSDAGCATIEEMFVDVRPVVTERRGKKTSASKAAAKRRKRGRARC